MDFPETFEAAIDYYLMSLTGEAKRRFDIASIGIIDQTLRTVLDDAIQILKLDDEDSPLVADIEARFGDDRGFYDELIYRDRATYEAYLVLFEAKLRVSRGEFQQWAGGMTSRGCGSWGSRTMLQRSIFSSLACGLLIAFLGGCATPDTHKGSAIEGAIPLKALFAHAAEWDGKPVRVEGYGYYLDGAVSVPHDHIVLIAAGEGPAKALGKNRPCDVGGTPQLLLMTPMPSGKLRKIGRHRLIVSGIFHNERTGVLYEPVTFEYPGWLSETKIDQVFDDVCGMT